MSLSYSSFPLITSSSADLLLKLFLFSYLVVFIIHIDRNSLTNISKNCLRSFTLINFHLTKEKSKTIFNN